MNPIFSQSEGVKQRTNAQVRCQHDASFISALQLPGGRGHVRSAAGLG
jgi:hypothetical protein